ncbi:unnamed protein product [Ilex paraguariensis]|uniref:Uncharacterized protein n=1 Tax=Ilex paraguariensis TaxID=185542 RepID=A0ABC8UCT3_9AQUA
MKVEEVDLVEGMKVGGEHGGADNWAGSSGQHIATFGGALERLSRRTVELEEMPIHHEIQLKSPNWLFGQRKHEHSNSVPKVASHDVANGGSQEEKGIDGLCDLNWLSSIGDTNEEDVFQRYLSMTSVDEGNGWYGGTLLGDQDENSEIYRHYAELCQGFLEADQIDVSISEFVYCPGFYAHDLAAQCSKHTCANGKPFSSVDDIMINVRFRFDNGPAMEPFQHDPEKEKHYADILCMGTIDCMDDAAVEAEMEASLKEYDQIGADLGIVPKSCKALAGDPSQLTRWIIGEERMHKV